ncbi:MAG: 6,7-dimethyl-8-ribityllumazine synthase [Chthoniobacteraceae bacterium]
MSTALPNRPRQILHRRSIAVVSSQYNDEFVQGLVSNFEEEIGAVAPGTHIHKYEVPGSFEIPLMVQELASYGGFDAIIAFGLIIQGETKHAELIGSAVTQALMTTSLQHRVPVIHEVLLVKDEEQARARCLGKDLNRGIEAARATAQMIQSFSEVRNRS